MTAANVALAYEPDGYTESSRPRPGGAAGLMGRQVAGKEFLDAYLSHGTWENLTAVVRDRAGADPLVKLCQSHPSSAFKQRRLAVVEEAEFLRSANSPVEVLHTPCPPNARYAWARQAVGPPQFAISGVTHTLSTSVAMAALGELVVAPFEPYDALICTSRAVMATVRGVTGAMADYLRERFGGNPHLKARVELIPLGVDVEKFRPPTATERAESRKHCRVADGEIVVLCVGRLSHHAKAHPYPVFHAVEQAAKRTGRPVHLVFAGWAAHPAVSQQYEVATRLFAPSVRTSFLDGQDPKVRASVWHAADLLISLPDNVQETFGLVLVEAMASGLPVVASDWNGYRDLVLDGETGFLVPSHMVRGANTESTARLLYGGINYDHFLADCSQTAVIDLAAAADAATRLVADDGLRGRFGMAGRERVGRDFSWSSVIRRYEQLWAEQAAELKAARLRESTSRGPVLYPPLERSFAAYPTTWLDEHTRVVAAPDAEERLPVFLKLPLTNHEAARRLSDSGVLQSVLKSTRQPRSIADVSHDLARAGAGAEAALATIAWLLKYGLLVTSAAT